MLQGALGPELFLSTPLLLRGGLLQPLALLEGGMLQPLASLEGEPPQIHEQELLQLQGNFLSLMNSRLAALMM